MKNVDSGVTKAREANEVILQLSESVGASREAVSNIYEVIRQQAEGMESIAISMDRIHLITRQNLASTRTVESVSTNLTRLANDLQSSVNPNMQAEMMGFPVTDDLGTLLNAPKKNDTDQMQLLDNDGEYMAEK
jgi:hypothetical protein